MTARQKLPEPFNSLTDLSSDLLGTFVLKASDDYFAAKENLLKPGPAVWLEDEYTDKGKWMDGWESQRRRTPGHDWAIIRLGAPGIVLGALVDTTHFKGNSPQEASIEGIEAPYTATAEELEAMDGWFEILPRVPLKADFQNAFLLEEPSDLVTHVRLRIFPDGGVARLRIWGTVSPNPRAFWRSGSVDLGAVENGGTIAAVSDEFFGPPANMLLPGRGVNMGDGWETKRRRTPGSDWAVVRLARRGVLDRIELDTHFFKGNAPQAVLLEAIDAEGMPSDELEKLLRAPKGWRVLVDKTKLVQHRRHQLDPLRPMPVTHVRVHIFPHGGVNRLRLYGTAMETADEAAALVKLNTLDEKKARALALSFCGAEAFADAFVERRPYSSMRELFEEAAQVWWGLPQKAWLEAYAAHPRLGAKKKAATATRKSAGWSKGEQKGVGSGEKDVLARLEKQNAAYFKKFGFIFILFASGRSAAEVLEQLEERLPRSKASEIDTAAQEQARITRLRIEKWLFEQLG
jgi:allantoicase